MSIFGTAGGEMMGGVYKYFLDEIRRYGVGVVPPDRFNRIINEAVLNWMKDKAKEVGVGQKRIDDLKDIHMYIPEGVLTIVAGNSFVLPTGVAPLDAYLRYWRADAIRVKDDIAGEWIPMSYLSPIRKSEVQKDPYAIPNPELEGYYWIVGDDLFMDIGGATVIDVEFEYYGYPPVLAFVDGLTDVPPVFEDEQILEIVNTATRMHLERIQSPRHQSFAVEDQIKPK